uniref:Uncharacterized protein n=1 Tax=Arundo donax TaxID=35708 RepID=A0A0A8YYG7_ARUDO
MSYWHHHITVS